MGKVGQRRIATTYRGRGGDVATGNSEYEVRALRLLIPRTKAGCFVATKDVPDWTESIELNVSTVDSDLVRSWVGAIDKGDFSAL
jgi:hypothetical protein